MRDHLQLRFQADGSEVRQVLRRAVRRFADAISAEDIGTLELVLAEVLNNVVEHAYASRPPGPVRLSLQRQGISLTCQVEDEGAPMPGLRPPEGGLRHFTGNIQDLAEGGWGWALIRALTADLRYARHRNINQLSFRLPLAGCQPP